MITMLRSAWDYRNFIFSSIINEYKTRFSRSRLGALWLALNPLAQVAIYTLILSAVLGAKFSGIGNKYAYAIYLMAGMLAWSLFSEVFGRCCMVFIDNGELIKKISFPKIALPLIVTGSALINNLTLFLAILLVFGVLGHFPLIAIVWIPLLTIATIFLAVGLGLSLGIINVFVRDIGQAIPIILQFWFWLTPIVYKTDMVPEDYHSLLLLNPMSMIVMGYQDILAFEKHPQLTLLFYPLAVSALAVGIALYLYSRASDEMADAL